MSLFHRGADVTTMHVAASRSRHIVYLGAAKVMTPTGANVAASLTPASPKVTTQNAGSVSDWVHSTSRWSATGRRSLHLPVTHGCTLFDIT